MMSGPPISRAGRSGIRVRNLRSPPSDDVTKRRRFHPDTTRGTPSPCLIAPIFRTPSFRSDQPSAQLTRGPRAFREIPLDPVKSSVVALLSRGTQLAPSRWRGRRDTRFQRARRPVCGRIRLNPVGHGMNISQLPRRPHPGYRFASAFALGLALVVTGAPSPEGGGILSAQALNPCSCGGRRISRPLAGNADVAEGVPNTFPIWGMPPVIMWGVGVGRFTSTSRSTRRRIFPRLRSRSSSDCRSLSGPGQCALISRSARSPCSNPTRPPTPLRPHW